MGEQGFGALMDFLQMHLTMSFSPNKTNIHLNLFLNHSKQKKRMFIRET